MADKLVMENTEKSWIKALQLKPEDFNSCPEGENPLVWALETQLIDESTYMEWASECHKLPILKGEFFNLGWDKTLTQTHQSLFDWDKDCFPIHSWNEILYIACLEPQNIATNMNVCFVLAPASKMKTTWDELQAEMAPPIQAPTPPTIPLADVEAPQVATLPTELPEKPSLEPSVLNFEIPAEPLKMEAPEPPERSPQGASEPADETETPLMTLDFGSLNTEPEKVIPKAATPAPKPPSTPQEPLQELDLSGLSMDPTPQAPKQPTAKAPEPPSSVDLEGFSFEPIGEAQPPTPPAAPPTPPKAQPLKPVASAAVPPPLPVNSPLAEAPAPPIAPPSIPDTFDDDQTPPPLAKEVAPQPVMAKPVSAGQSNTPPEHTLTIDNLSAAKPLKETHSIPGMVEHIFSRIHKDFEKLMWIPKSKSKGYVPDLVFGPWMVKESTWTTPVNLKVPNIFRIAWSSKLPFHGAPSPNDANAVYFKHWDSGKSPEHLTVYPLCTEAKKCLGFVVGYGKGPEFHNKQTLKKFETTMQLVEKQLKSSSIGKAS